MNSQLQPSRLNLKVVELMLEKELSINALAKKSGVSVGTIQNLVSDPYCNPTLSSLEAVCNVLGVSLNEVISEDATFQEPNHIPLLSWDDLKYWFNPSVPAAVKDPLLFPNIKTSCAVSSKSFAFSVPDHSFGPLFPKGAILIFDPGKPYDTQSYVLIKLAQSSTIVFKQLSFEAPHYCVKPLNPALQENITQLTPEDHILATLIQAQIQY